MKKYIVETYYTCTFKTVHSLSDLNEKELSKIDGRTDGDVEVIDVKLNNRKTKKIGESNKKEDKELKPKKSITESISKKITAVNEIGKKEGLSNLKNKNNSRFKMPDRRKDYIKKLRLGIIKYICIQENTMMVKLVKYLLTLIKKENLLKQ